MFTLLVKFNIYKIYKKLYVCVRKNNDSKILFLILCTCTWLPSVC